jgi:adenylosuccinate synthase
MEWDYSGFLLDGLPFDEYESQWFEAIEVIKHMKLIDSEYFLHQSLKENKRILAEGAQGTLLDVDFGTYPFVTSSNTSCAGVCSGLGIPPARIGNVFGIVKAYCTRVGSGPFPTELFDETGERMRNVGSEFGSTTGRPRRCGWLDLVALQYAIMINGVTHLIMTKADVLSGFETIRICTRYRRNDEYLETIPFGITRENYTPVYQDLPGWSEDLSGLESWDDAPWALKDYVRFIEKATGVPFFYVSVGAGRKQILKIG